MVVIDGIVIISDGLNDRVQYFYRDGAWVGTLAAGPGTGNYQVEAPGQLAINQDHNNIYSIYVADFDNNRVQMYNFLGGGYVRTIGSGVAGSGDNQLFKPAGVAVDRQGNVYVADLGNDRVQKFDNQGRYVRTFGSHGSGPGQLDNPFRCAVTSTGDLFVVEAVNKRVQQFAANGDFIRFFSGAPLIGPSSVFVDDHDNLYITDEDAGGVFRFTLRAATPS